MKVKFKDGTVKNCTAPIEQKIFKNPSSPGWVLQFGLTGQITSADIDALFTDSNIDELVFKTEDEEKSVTLSGYNRLSSSVIRYAEDVVGTVVEVQLTKGV